MNDRSKKILAQIKRDYKKLKLVVIDKKEMLRLQSKYKTIIDGWVMIR